MIVSIFSTIVDYVKRVYNEIQETTTDVTEDDDIGEMTFLLSIFL